MLGPSWKKYIYLFILISLKECTTEITNYEETIYKRIFPPKKPLFSEENYSFEFFYLH